MTRKLYPASLALLWAAGLATTAPALAQYKIVGPDGRITYTDRPPADATGKVSNIGRTGGAAAAANAEVALPFDLRQVATRYPVTLYAGDNCQPCDSARQLLQQRGVPYVERRIAGDEDQQALERLVGGRTIPALTVGAQPLRGFAPADWTAFLDAAGYPKESRLPRGWQPPAPTPLVERVAAQRPAGAPAAPPRPAPSDAPPAPAPQPAPQGDPPATPGIRF